MDGSKWWWNDWDRFSRYGEHMLFCQVVLYMTVTKVTRSGWIYAEVLDLTVARRYMNIIDGVLEWYYYIAFISVKLYRFKQCTSISYIDFSPSPFIIVSLQSANWYYVEIKQKCLYKKIISISDSIMFSILHTNGKYLGYFDFKVFWTILKQRMGFYVIF